MEDKKQSIIKINDIVKYLNIGQITGTNHLILDFNRIDDNDTEEIYQIFSNIILKHTNGGKYINGSK